MYSVANKQIKTRGDYIWNFNQPLRLFIVGFSKVSALLISENNKKKIRDIVYLDSRPKPKCCCVPTAAATTEKVRTEEFSSRKWNLQNAKHMHDERLLKMRQMESNGLQKQLCSTLCRRFFSPSTAMWLWSLYAIPWSSYLFLRNESKWSKKNATVPCSSADVQHFDHNSCVFMRWREILTWNDINSRKNCACFPFSRVFTLLRSLFSIYKINWNTPTQASHSNICYRRYFLLLLFSSVYCLLLKIQHSPKSWWKEEKWTGFVQQAALSICIKWLHSTFLEWIWMYFSSILFKNDTDHFVNRPFKAMLLNEAVIKR